MSELEYCPSCKKPFRIPPSHMGRKVRCDQCGTVFVTGAQSVSQAAPSPQPAAPQLQDDDFDDFLGDSKPAYQQPRPGGRVGGGAATPPLSPEAEGSTIPGDELDDWLELEKGETISAGGKKKSGGLMGSMKKFAGGTGVASTKPAFETSIFERLSAVGLVLILVGVVLVATGDPVSRVFSGVFGGSSEPVSARLLSQLEDRSRIVFENATVGTLAAGEIKLPALPGPSTKPVLAATLVDQDSGQTLAVVLTEKPDGLLSVDDSGAITLKTFDGYVNGTVADRPELLELVAIESEIGAQTAVTDAIETNATPEDDVIKDAGTLAAAPLLTENQGEVWVIEDGAPFASLPVIGLLPSLAMVVGMGCLLGGIAVSVMAWISGGYGGGSDLVAPGAVLGYAVLGFVLANVVGAAGFKYWVWLGMIAGLLVFAFGWLGLASGAMQRSTVQGLLCALGPFAPVQMATRWKDAKEPTTWIASGLGCVLIAIGGLAGVGHSVEASGNRVVAAMVNFSSQEVELKDVEKIALRAAEDSAEIVARLQAEEEAQSLANAVEDAGGIFAEPQDEQQTDPDPDQNPDEGVALTDPERVAEEPLTPKSADEIELGQLVISEGTASDLESDTLEGAIPVIVRRTLEDAFPDPAIRDYMNPEEKLIADYGFFVSRDFNESEETDKMGRYWFDVSRYDMAKVEFTVHDVPALKTLEGKTTPLLTEDGEGPVKGYVGDSQRVRGYSVPFAKVKTYAPVNGIVFTRIEPKPQNRMQTVYFVAIDQGKLLTFRLDCPSEADNFLTLMSILQASVGSIAPAN